MKDNINNNSATSDIYEALHPFKKKDFDGDSVNYFCSVVKEETNKDGELEILLRLGSRPKRLDTKSKAAEKMIAYEKNI